MIVLKADATLTAVFHKTIKVMEQNVSWNETFIINNNTLILPGTLKSLFFSFDNKKVIGNVIEQEIKEEPQEMRDNKLLENAVNMVLYVFGKWGKIKGLTVEQDYRHLDNLMNDILQEVDVKVQMGPDNCRFYKDDVRITYEEVIELILEYIEPEQTENEEDSKESREASWDDKYKLGLWHKMVWKSYSMTFLKRALSADEKKSHRMGKDFYITGYQCPECGDLLHMVVYPLGNEVTIETDEGRVVLARAYACDTCKRFYTPKPYKLLLENSIYMMDFDEDSVAFEDYLELMGENGARTSNSNFNMFENDYKNHGKEPEGRSLEQMYENMSELTDEDIIDIADMFDSGFYTPSQQRMYEQEFEDEIKKRGISKYSSKEHSAKADKGSTDNNSESSGKNQNAQKSQKAHKNENAKTHGSYSDVPYDRADTQKTEKMAAHFPRVDKAVTALDNGDDDTFERLTDNFTEEELKQTYNVLKNKTESVPKERKEQVLKKVETKLFKRQQTDLLKMAMEVKDKPYKDMRQVYKKIKEKDCADSVKSGVLDTLKNLMQQRGKKELQVLIEHIPDNISRAVYSQFKEKFKEYDDIDNAPYIEMLDQKRDAIEQRELAEFVRKNNRRPKDRKSLLELIEKIKPLDYEERNKEIYTQQLLDNVRAIDEAAIKRICPDVFDMTFDEAKEAYKRISEGDFLPELKADMLSHISKRLEALKKDECRNLVNKLVRDTDWHTGNVEGIYIYDIRRMSNENCDDTDAIIVNNALNTYGAGEKYEYPLLVYDSTKAGNGKKGFVLTPDHIYYNSSMTAGTVKMSEVGGFFIETGLFNKGIYVKKGNESLKLTGNIKGDKNVLDLYLKQLNKFIKYLKEKPESRNVEYLAKEKHDVKCCTRCGYVYKYGNVCPKCGSRNE